VGIVGPATFVEDAGLVLIRASEISLAQTPIASGNAVHNRLALLNLSASIGLESVPHHFDDVGNAHAHQTEDRKNETEKIDKLTEIGNSPNSPGNQGPYYEREQEKHNEEEQAIKGPPGKIFDLPEKIPV
jgi:hypothetical protein